MTKARIFDPDEHTVGIRRDLSAELIHAQPDPPVPVDGVTFGVVTMTESAPHAGECHPDGDEVLYLIAGRVKLIMEEETIEEVVMGQGDGVVVPKGVWHRVEILEPSTIVYMTPGPNNEFRTLSGVS